MSLYKEANKDCWSYTVTDQKLYLCEKVQFSSIKEAYNNTVKETKNIALLGYSSDEGAKRKNVKPDVFLGPDAIRKQLGKMCNHLNDDTQLIDFGNFTCLNENLQQLSELVSNLLEKNFIPIILGGSHDLVYGHFNGLAKNLKKDKKIGIINFDARFDLEDNTDGNNAHTSLFQIALEHEAKNEQLHYMALGIRKDVNTKNSFNFVASKKLHYLAQNYFSINYLEHVQLRLIQFIEDVDFLYTTIDLDGFSTAYAPGVSNASPLGFAPDIVLESLKIIVESGKLIGLDVAELNPKFDIEDQTTKLAASLIHYVIHKL